VCFEKSRKLKKKLIETTVFCLVYCERLCGGEHGEDSEEEAGACGESFRRETHTEPKTGTDR